MSILPEIQKLNKNQIKTLKPKSLLFKINPNLNQNQIDNGMDIQNTYYIYLNYDIWIKLFKNPKKIKILFGVLKVYFKFLVFVGFWIIRTKTQIICFGSVLDFIKR